MLQPNVVTYAVNHFFQTIQIKFAITTITQAYTVEPLIHDVIYNYEKHTKFLFSSITSGDTIAT